MPKFNCFKPSDHAQKKENTQKFFFAAMIKTNKRKHEKGNGKKRFLVTSKCVFHKSACFLATKSRAKKTREVKEQSKNGENTEEGSEDPYEKYFRS